jgi:hypothetical protein
MKPRLLVGGLLLTLAACGGSKGGGGAGASGVGGGASGIGGSGGFGQAGDGGVGGDAGSAGDGDAGIAGSGGATALPSCDPNAIILVTMPDGMTTMSMMGDNSTAQAMLDPQTAGCLNNGNSPPPPPTGPETVYGFVVPGSGTKQLTASTDDPSTAADTVVYIATACGGGTELACNDDAGMDNTNSTVTASVMGGQTVYIVVDSYDSDSAGAYKLTLTVQ